MKVTTKHQKVKYRGGCEKTEIQAENSIQSTILHPIRSKLKSQPTVDYYYPKWVTRISIPTRDHPKEGTTSILISKPTAGNENGKEIKTKKGYSNSTNDRHGPT